MSNQIESKTIDQILGEYIKVRDARDEAAKAFEERDQHFKKVLYKMEMELLRRANEAGVEQFKSQHGTAFTQTNMKASVADKKVLNDFLRDENIDPLDILQARVTTRGLQDYMDAHEGKTPPGVDIFREKVVRVRRPSKK